MHFVIQYQKNIAINIINNLINISIMKIVLICGLLERGLQDPQESLDHTFRNVDIRMIFGAFLPVSAPVGLFGGKICPNWCQTSL